MIERIFKGHTARVRIALGLSGMLVSLLLLAAIIGLVPDRHGAIRDGQARLAEAIAVNSSIFITTADIRRMKANLMVTVERSDNILSAGVRRADGQMLAVIGEHSKLWLPHEQGKSIEAQVVVPIFEGSKQWGQVELVFVPLLPAAWYGSFLNPVFLLLGFISFTSFIVFFLYLGKMLKQLDPSQAIPDRVRSALDTMAEGLLVIDAQQNIVLANLAFTNITDESSESLMGRSIAKLPWFDSNDRPLSGKDYPWSKTLADGILRTADMIRLTTKDGDSRTFMTNCSPVMSGSGKPAGVLISFDDVTELEQKELELRISKEEAEQANRFKSEFLANMSHEIRTPMNAILGFAEVLKRGYDKNSSDSIRYLNTISSSGNHLLGLINDILDLSKVEAGEIDIEIIQTPVHHIIHEVVQIMQIKAKEKNLYLRYEPAGPIPEYINTDAAKIRQMLTNLVGNAIKFTESGGISIITKLNTDGAEPMLVIEVVDTGIGMTAAQADDIFNPFTQADSSITRRFGGTGLGLTISKRFAEALGGDITVSSEPGVGSRFQTTISMGSIEGVTLLSVDEILSSQINDVVVKQQQWKFPAAKILVVDDGEENRDLLEVILTDAGIAIETAENGQIALDWLAKESFDVVLMDVQMPVMDGMTAVGLMRQREFTLPVIAMTADAMMGVKQQCLDAGYSEYMTKPVNIDQLLEKLAELLGGELLSEQEINESQQHRDSADAQQQSLADVSEAEITETEKIYSTLPMSNPKFRSIVEKFIIRLGTQMDAIDSAWQARDYVELKRLGHWLKGSAGSVGLGQFAEPAKEFEQYAIEKDDVNLARSIQQLHTLCSRVSLLDGQDGTAQSARLSPDAKQYKTVDARKVPQPLKDYDIPEILVSHLADKPRIRPIIEKFIVQLSERCEAIDELVAKQDFVGIEKFAYWLKASAGSVGFAAFTEPAKDLETSSRDRNLDYIIFTVSVIKDLGSRIRMPESEQAKS